MRILVVGLSFLLHVSFAGSVVAENKRAPRHYETWFGADASKQSWLVYSGGTFAPFGDIHEQGWKFRAVSGYGRYRVCETGCQHPNRSEHVLTDGWADTYFIDALAGYLWRLDPVIAKFFVGFSAIEHRLPFDTGLHLVEGQEFGVKLQAEFWFNLSENFWGSLDASWTSAHNARAARWRLGYKVLPEFSLGLEASVHADNQSFCRLDENANCVELNEREAFQKALTDNGRVGVFARHNWDGGEISGSVGIVGYDAQSSDHEIYGKLNYLMQF